MLVDYGNVVQVMRREVWAPVAAMKQFTQPPFGILCRMENISHVSLPQWQRALLDKPVKVIIGSCSPDGRVHTVHLPDCLVNASIINILESNGKEVYPVLTPCGPAPPFPSGNILK